MGIIIESQLKGFSPSLKEKIVELYSKYEQYAKPITEQEGHDKLEITKFYTLDMFCGKVSKFMNIRNKLVHTGIIWNAGVEIYTHLKLLIYFSIMERASYSMEEIVKILSCLFTYEF